VRKLIFLICVGVFIWFGFTVPLGKYTLFGHIRRIWHTQETQDLVKGAEDTAKPVVDKVKRGVQAGVDEAKRNP
jgi:hypothetical protein